MSQCCYALLPSRGDFMISGDTTMIDLLLASPLGSIAVISVVVLIVTCLYRVTVHPLSHIPGPLIPKITSLWLYYHAYIGDEATAIHELHNKYGPLIRVAPNEVDIADVDAVSPIYVSKGGFRKAPCYVNFDIDLHRSIFSALDPEQRSPRAKAVIPLFSTKSIRDNEAAIYGCVDTMVGRMQDESGSGKPVNVLNLTRSLALDAVSTHLFRENYNGISEKGEQLSASAFVDLFVGVGRFFYLPNVVFTWTEWAIGKLYPSERTTSSLAVVDKFVDDMVTHTKAGAQTYPGRLLAIGLTPSEVKAQCKDLMFAGTDSTGANLARICQELARSPDRYQALRSEVVSNLEAGTAKTDAQALPYLSAVVKEALRISMANPTRLPRIVPSSGWTFKGTNFPSGAIVGCSAYELHLNPAVFPNPQTFQPERWLRDNVTPEMRKHSFAFGAGSRACIARNLATTELYLATEKLAESGVLRGARPCKDSIEIYEWFNSRVKDEKVELVWGV
ncbi:cytochrome P450 [Calycina marina]|uniref:Cytochrome P450 n=1 Tax=Calycina marina TaxID=1763456 RepID=A0A9P8CAF1_9HELO|nr:cytochrome P450 [Calycina marina]